jgi:branched-chain amino acid transport system ATP-binding protein
VLRVEDIRVSYGQVTALWGVSFEVGKGEIVALVGGNGAGKTTTLKTVSGLLRPAAGRIVLDEDELQERSTMEIRR